jgi:hypothetical protein
MSKNVRNTATIWAPLSEVRISDRRRRSINQATMERYRQWLEQGREAPPVRLARHDDAYVVRDGRHRVAGAVAAGHAFVKAELQRIVEMVRAAVGRRSSFSPRQMSQHLGTKLCRQSNSFAARRSGFDSRRLHSLGAAA